MYEYAYYRLPDQTAPFLLPYNRPVAYLDLCHRVIEGFAQQGWRFVTIIKPCGDDSVSELVFERPVQ